MSSHNLPSSRGFTTAASCLSTCATTVVLLCLLGQVVTAQTVDPFSPDTRTPGGAAVGVIANAEFVDAPVTTVFRMISDMTGWSIVMSPEVSKQPPRINIWIKNLAPEEVLEQVTVMSGLTMERKGGTVRVMTFDEYTRTYGVQQRMIQVKHASARNIANALKQFAAKEDQARILADEQSNSIVLLVPKPLIDSLARLAEELDVPYESDKIELVTLKHLRAATIVPELEKFLSGTLGSQSRSSSTSPGPVSSPGAAETAAGAGYVLKFMIEPRLNVVVLRGAANDVARAVSLVKSLDVPHEATIATYEFHYVNAKDVFNTIREMMTESQTGTSRRNTTSGESGLKLSLSEQTNRIVVEGTSADHAKVAQLVAAIDVPLPSGTSATRVYRLTNATAEEVAKVISGLIEDANEDRVARTTTSGGESESGRSGLSPASPPEPAAVVATSSENFADVTNAPGMSIPARVTAVPEINAIVIRASAAEHEEFEHVIREIDKPRDQVILEVTIVRVRADNGFTLGLELGGGRLGGRTQSIGFTAFGVGTPDSATGVIQITDPSPLGLNFAVFNSDDFSLVLNALETVGEVRVTSAPKLLVQDNAVAMISQTSQEPYETTSQGESTTVTSFGGFVDAGTTLTVYPHISQENWLRMDYEVQMSTFGTRTAEQLAANLPPPKSETKAAGTVRVPAEHTVVLGGLTGDHETENVDTVPFLGNVPLIGELFKNRSSSTIKETTYLFIRPIILRDPSFKDLLYLSEEDIRQARIRQDEYPTHPLKSFVARESDERDTTEGE